MTQLLGSNMHTLESVILNLYLNTDLLNRYARFVDTIIPPIKANKPLTIKQSVHITNLLISLVPEIKLAGCTDYVEPILTKNWKIKPMAVEKFRKLVIDGDRLLVVTSHPDVTLRQVIFENSSSFSGRVTSFGQKELSFPLCERNIEFAVALLKRYNVTISNELLNYAAEIKRVQQTENTEFDIDCNAELRGVVSREINIADNLLVHDRKFKYQYTTTREIDHSNCSLLDLAVASRKDTRIFVSSEQHTVEDLLKTFSRLGRNRILVVVDEYNPKKSLKFLIDFNNHCASRTVGVYARMETLKDKNAVDDYGQQFNTFIKQANFTNRLNDSLDVAMISNSNLPKFMLTSDWYPDVVVSITSRFKNTKAACYCNRVDLIIDYAKEKPLGT